jgi:hypothetical protein
VHQRFAIECQHQRLAQRQVVLERRQLEIHAEEVGAEVGRIDRLLADDRFEPAALIGRE